MTIIEALIQLRNDLRSWVAYNLQHKIDKEEGKGLSTNDYTDSDKNKLDGIATNAEVNVQSDWAIQDESSDAFIKNKPTKLSDFTNDSGFITGVSWGEVTEKPTFATVATSGSYNDLSNKPTIPTIPDYLPNQYSLKFGDKSYNGSSEQTITAADLGLSQALKYHGVSETALTDGSTTNPITILGESHTAESGCVVFYNNKEFVWNGSVWEELGDLSGVDFTGYATEKWVEDKKYLTQETDPVFNASPAKGITNDDIKNWNNKTSNVGTITGIKMNGVSKGTSGVVDLGTVITNVDGKVDKVDGKGLSENDFTDTLKTKLEGLSNYDDTSIQESINKKQDKITDLDTIRTGSALGATALQSVPAEYVTETELTGKGYATTAQVNAKQDVITDLDTIRSGAAAGASAETAAKSYADSLSVNYDAAGAAAQALADAKSYFNAENAKDATRMLAIEGDVDALEATVGDTTSGLVKEVAALRTEMNALGSIDGGDGIGGMIDAKIAALDVEDTAVVGQYVSSVSEADGKITVTRVDLPDYTKDFAAKANASDLTAHTGDTVAHITADERTAWNAAKSSIDAFLKDADMSEKAVDTLAELQTYMNGDGEAAAELVGRVAALEAIDHDAYKAADTALETSLKLYADQAEVDALAAAKADAASLYQVKGNYEAAGTAASAIAALDLSNTYEAKGAAATAQAAAAEDATSKANAAQIAAIADAAGKYQLKGNYATVEQVNAKQDVIEDLDVIRSGATLGATALQAVPEEYVTETELKNKGYLTAKDISQVEIVDNLTTEDSTKALSANQGVVINKSITTVDTNLNKKIDETVGNIQAILGTI